MRVSALLSLFLASFLSHILSSLFFGRNSSFDLSAFIYCQIDVTQVYDTEALCSGGRWHSLFSVQKEDACCLIRSILHGTPMGSYLVLSCYSGSDFFSHHYGTSPVFFFCEAREWLDACLPPLSVFCRFFLLEWLPLDTLELCGEEEESVTAM